MHGAQALTACALSEVRGASARVRARTTKPPKAPSVLNSALPDARARPSRNVAGHDQMGPVQRMRGLRHGAHA